MTENMPITRAEALRRGHTPKELRGGRFRRLFRGVYLPSTTEVSPVQRVRGALLIAPPGAYASHHTAAQLWGAVAPVTNQTHISVPDLATRSVCDGIAAHRAETTFPPTVHRGVPVSIPAAVFLELATLHLDLVALVVLGDSLVRRARITPEVLTEAASRWSGKGARLARRAAALVRAGVDSAMETRLRLLIVLAGLPEPMVNVIVRDENGEWSLRFDLCYPQLKLVIEYDGVQHRIDPEQWSRDLRRREWLEANGWRIIVLNSDAFSRESRQTLQRIRQALVDRGCRDLPTRTPAAWDRHVVRNAAWPKSTPVEFGPGDWPSQGPNTLVDFRPQGGDSAGKGSRTPMSLRTDGFEPSAYTIPPPRPSPESVCHSRNRAWLQCRCDC